MDLQSEAEPVEVRYYPHDGSVFLDSHYLIKGVAGAIFWKLAREHTRPRREEFSTRELRLAGRELRLPELQDNLSVRLLLLQRRLAERNAPLQIGKVGRGRYRVALLRPMSLLEPGTGSAVVRVDSEAGEVRVDSEAGEVGAVAPQVGQSITEPGLAA